MTLPDTLLLYHTLSEESLHAIQLQAPATLSQRYTVALTARFQAMSPHRASLAELFADAMRQQDHPLFQAQDSTRDGFLAVLQGSVDTVRPDELADMVNFLYALYWLVMLFWLYDRTPETRATFALIEFMGDMLKMIRPLMIMPLFSKALGKISGIMKLVFG